MKTDNVLLTVLRHSGNVNSSYHYGESKTEMGWCGVEDAQGWGWGGRDREDATTISTLQTDKWGVGWGGVGVLTSDKQREQPTNSLSGDSWTRTSTERNKLIKRTQRLRCHV